MSSRNVLSAAASGALSLWPLRPVLEGMYRDFLFPEDGPEVSFRRPEGEPALVGPDSVSWQVFRNPVTLFIGGVTAVLLELAEPRVRHGVWTHSDFRQHPKGRLQRTGLAAMVTVYGARSEAESLIGHVRHMHDKVEGVAEDGRAYRANDPELLDWVQATAMFGFVEAYHRFARPLSEEERDRVLGESRPAATLYGAVGAPSSQAEMEALFARMAPALTPSPILHEFLDLMAKAPVLPMAARPLQQVMLKAARALVPAGIAGRIGVGPVTLDRTEEWLLRLAAETADKLDVACSPPVEACRRLGLPKDNLSAQGR